MTERELYRTQVTLVLASLAAILACSVHGFYFAESRFQLCIDFAILTLSALVIVYADNLAVKFSELASKTQSPERAPPALE